MIDSKLGYKRAFKFKFKHFLNRDGFAKSNVASLRVFINNIKV